jgi:DNA-directed RNA polymerase specialized sigma24 family protein
MARALGEIFGYYGKSRDDMNDPELIERFTRDPESAYKELLERFTPMILRMIHRFMRDPDDVMEVYTAICERLQAHDYQALRRFRTNSELTPWLSVVVANACRDHYRKQRFSSVPRSVLAKLDAREQLIFKYYYQERMRHEDIAELVSSRHAMPCSPLEVVHTIAKINDLLSTKKRWLLLTALNSNRAPLSIDELSEAGILLPDPDAFDDLDEALRQKDQITRLNQALEQLESEDQLLVQLRFEHGMTAIQIAKVMQYESHKYVYTRLRTVVNRLRRLMSR